jgi:hypothetical protein
MIYIEKVVQRFLQTRDQAHSLHWTTKSYAAHKALGDFYDSLLDGIDNFIEAYSGKHPEAFSQKAKIPVSISIEPNASPDGMMSYFMDFNKFLETLCADLVENGDGDLEHLVLDLKNDTNKLLYLLRLK